MTTAIIGVGNIGGALPRDLVRAGERVVLTVLAKLASGYGAGVVGGFSPRQSLNVGAALVAHGEFTIILAQIASENDAIPSGDRSDFVAFAGLYVLATATLGVILMKESKRIGRRLFPPRLA